MTIAAQYGGDAIPLTAPATGDPVADRGLGVLLRYLQAYITAYAGAAWATVAPSEPIVRSVFAHDPEQHVFSDTHLPALYAFATKSAKKPEQIAEDWRVNYDTIKVFWVLPPCSQEREALREPMASAVAALIDRALRQGGDPSFIDPGDTDPYAVGHGTVFLRRAGYIKAERGDWHLTNLAIQASRAGDGERILRRALETSIDVSKRLEELPESYSVGANHMYASVSVGGVEAAAHSAIGGFSSGFSAGFNT